MLFLLKTAKHVMNTNFSKLLRRAWYWRDVRLKRSVVGAKLDGSYLKILGGELKLVGCHIRPYSKAMNRETIDPDRTRIVLVSKKELRILKNLQKKV